MYSINVGGKLLEFHQPAIMGILNVTPDSFFDGGTYHQMPTMIEHVDKMISEGADIIDIGAQSTRPGAKILSGQEEWKRLKPVLEILKEYRHQVFLSVDTFWGEVVKKAAHLLDGKVIINDISGGMIDNTMFDVVADLGTPYVLTHIKGTPQTMKKSTMYKDLPSEMLQYFGEKIESLKKKGVKDIMIDVGFGFAKTVEQNYQLLRILSVFNILEYPLLAGISRKSMVWKPLNITPDEALHGSSALHFQALLQGVSILRVHDVKEAVQIVAVQCKYQGNDKRIQ